MAPAQDVRCIGGDCRPEWNWRRTDCPVHGDDASDGRAAFERARKESRARLAREREERELEAAVDAREAKGQTS